MVSNPTGPAPNTATLEPFWICAFFAACQAVGRISDRKSALSSDSSWGTFKRPRCLSGRAHTPPVRPARRVKMAVSQTARQGRELLLFSAAPCPRFVFSQAILLLAKEAVTAGNHKQDRHPVTFLHVFTSLPHSTTSPINC